MQCHGRRLKSGGRTRRRGAGLSVRWVRAVSNKTRACTCVPVQQRLGHWRRHHAAMLQSHGPTAHSANPGPALRAMPTLAPAVLPCNPAPTVSFHGRWPPGSTSRSCSTPTGRCLGVGVGVGWRHGADREGPHTAGLGCGWHGRRDGHGRRSSPTCAPERLCTARSCRSAAACPV